MSDHLLCDTCVIIDFMSGRSQELDDLMAGNVTLFINSIIEMELLQGARDNVELRRIEKKLSTFRLLNMQQIIFDLATQFIRNYRLIARFIVAGCRNWRDRNLLPNALVYLQPERFWFICLQLL